MSVSVSPSFSQSIILTINYYWAPEVTNKNIATDWPLVDYVYSDTVIINRVLHTVFFSSLI